MEPTSANENQTLMIAWQSKVSVFVGSKVSLVTALDPTEGEVKPLMFVGPFLEAFSVNNLSTKSEHEKLFYSSKKQTN